MHRYILDSLNLFLIRHLPLRDLDYKTKNDAELALVLQEYTEFILNDQTAEIKRKWDTTFTRQTFDKIDPKLSMFALIILGITETLSREYRQAYTSFEFADTFASSVASTEPGANIPIQLAKATLGCISNRIGSSEWTESLRTLREVAELASRSDASNQKYVVHALLSFVRVSCCEPITSWFPIVEKAFNKGKEIVREHCPNDFWEQSRIYQCEASLCFRKGEFDNAERWLKSTLEILERRLVDHHPLKMEIMLDLAHTYIYSKRPELARNILESAIENELQGPKEELRLALLFHNLGEAEHLINGPNQAFPFLQKALTHYEKLSNEHLFDRLSALFLMRLCDAIPAAERKNIEDQIENINIAIDQCTR